MTFALQRADLLRARAAAVDFDPHLHATYSVVVVLTGTAHIWSSRWSRTVHAGDVFFFNPFEVHAGRSAGPAAQYHVLYPSEAFLDSCTGAVPPDQVRTIHTDVLARSRATHDLADALAEPVLDNASIERALRIVLRECRFAVESPATASWSITRAACELIECDSLSSMRTEELARAIGVNPSHLVRSFRKTIGIPPQTYLRQVRVARARDLICAGFGLNDVAQMVNFSDQPHLTREFKKVFGVPPGALSRVVSRT